MIANLPTMPHIEPKRVYTYADYLTWCDNKRYELYNGSVYEMMPAPSRKHQEVSANLVFLFKQFTQNRSCKVFHAPFDVRLPQSSTATADDQIYTVVQPDIVVVCDPNKLDDRGCLGAPDLIVEILSPSNSQNDIDEKFTLYEQAGVPEYWIIHPVEETLLVYRLGENDQYVYQQLYSNMGQVKVSVFQDVVIDLRHVFQS